MPKGSLDRPKENASALEVIARAARDVEPIFRKTVKEHAKGPAAELYGRLEGFLSGGKRFRPALALYLGEALHARKQTFAAALAIELFHNFTLVHDDIIDGDKMRRGKPTVWNEFGTEHAINSGDALFLLASELCLKAEKEGGPGLGSALFEAFRGVIRGQDLDIAFANKPLQSISEKNYLEMIQLKTGVLVGVSAEAPGIAAGKNKTERENLRVFGESLGMAYQIADDYRSVWAEEETTGKDAYGDIRERKRALPAVMAASAISGAGEVRLSELYNMERPLNTEEVTEARNLIDSSDIREEVLARIVRYADRAKKAAEKLTLPAKTLQILEKVVDELTSMA